jgi:hypothetical protein
METPEIETKARIIGSRLVILGHYRTCLCPSGSPLLDDTPTGVGMFSRMRL